MTKISSSFFIFLRSKIAVVCGSTSIFENNRERGEASNLLTDDFKNVHSETPWKQITGMRNYIVHEYFQVDNTVIWDVIQNDLPQLEQQVKEYLKEFS